MDVILISMCLLAVFVRDTASNLLKPVYVTMAWNKRCLAASTALRYGAVAR